MLLKVVFVRGMGALFTFGLAVLLARWLGAAEYGRYIFLVGTAGFIATVGQLGSGMALVKFRLEEQDEEALNNPSAFYMWHIIVSLAGCLVGALLFAIILDPMRGYSAVEVVGMIVACFLVFLPKNLFQSIKRSELSLLPDMFFLPILLGAFVLLLNVQSADAAFAFYILCSVIGLCICAGIFYVCDRAVFMVVSIDIKWREWLGRSFGFLNSQLGHALIFLQLPVAYGFVASSEDMGLFSAAYKLAAIQLLAFAAIGTYALPRFADHKTVKDKSGLRSLLVQIVGMSALMAAPIMLVLILFPEKILFHLYGESFTEAANLVPIVAVGIFFHCATGPLGNFLIMNNLTRFYSVVSVLAGIVGIGAILLLSPVYGATGAAVCLAITIVVWKTIICFRGVALYRQLHSDETIR